MQEGDEHYIQTSNQAQHFRRPSFTHHGGGSKEEARGNDLGNKVFGSRWCDTGSLGLGVKRLRRSAVQN
jgi:hypothetical protein